MFAANHFADPAAVLRVMIVGLGGFTTATAVLLAGWNLRTWQRGRAHKRQFAALLLGLQLLAFAGLAALTTDHIYRHLIDQEAAAWQLWLSLLSFTVGAATLTALISVRFDRQTPR